MDGVIPLDKIAMLEAIALWADRGNHVGGDNRSDESRRINLLSTFSPFESNLWH
jgi:hypothetical protein